MISTEQKKKIQQIVNVFETGKKEGKYEAIAKLSDGPNGIKQITYGRTQTTEYGSLKRLLEMYITRNGKFASDTTKYINKIGKQPSLVSDDSFIQILKEAGKDDPVMQACQDDFFDMYYFHPALVWFEGYGFTLPLSLLVIYDSFIHSGRIRGDIRQQFSERPPKFGGEEKTWITQYVDARHKWLKNHKRTILHATAYRTQCFKNQIKNDNWDLSQPVNANGITVS